MKLRELPERLVDSVRDITFNASDVVLASLESNRYKKIQNLRTKLQSVTPAYGVENLDLTGLNPDETISLNVNEYGYSWQRTRPSVSKGTLITTFEENPHGFICSYQDINREGKKISSVYYSPGQPLNKLNYNILVPEFVGFLDTLSVIGFTPPKET